MDIVGKILELDEALTRHDIAHAFGGALALAWCTQQARGTIDIDVNLFTDAADLARVKAALPPGVVWKKGDEELLVGEGQVRLFWDKVPVDIFLNTTPYHEGLAERIRFEDFAGCRVPFLSCTDLAVFKVFFNRPKDWVDLAEMVATGSLDVDVVLGVVVRYLGGSDPRVERLRDVVRGARPDDH